MRSSLFWDVMQRTLIVSYQCAGTTNQSHCQGSSSPAKHPATTLNMIQIN